jgi:hypothetical protein
MISTALPYTGLLVAAVALMAYPLAVMAVMAALVVVAAAVCNRQVSLVAQEAVHLLIVAKMVVRAMDILQLIIQMVAAQVHILVREEVALAT